MRHWKTEIVIGRLEMLPGRPRKRSSRCDRQGMRGHRRYLSCSFLAILTCMILIRFGL
jgi:hypothetical protein